MSSGKKIAFKVNGQNYDVVVEPQKTLLELLREDLHLTGTKEGCGEGDCGACIVLVNGRAVNSCLMLAVDADGTKVVTVEGLAREEQLDPLQESFIEKGAVQCGYCSPGMIMSAKALLLENPTPSKAEIKEALSGVICRCACYPKIVEAVEDSAEKNKGTA